MPVLLRFPLALARRRPHASLVRCIRTPPCNTKRLVSCSPLECSCLAIRDWKPPYGVTDEQLRGPYLRWVHEYVFEPHPRGTLARDRMYYEVPGGRIVNAVIAERDVRRIFEYRRDCLRQLFAPAPAPEPEVVSWNR